MTRRWVSVFIVVALLVAAFTLWRMRRPPLDDSDRSARQAVTPAAMPTPAQLLPRLEEQAPTERVAVEPAAPASTAPAPTHLVRGRLVDDRRYPVAGAHVELCIPGVDAPAVTSGDSGRFEIEIAMPVHPGEGSCVRARDDAGRAGSARLWMPLAKEGERVEVDAGAIVLLDAYSLRVRVLDGGAPCPGARVRLALGHARIFAGEIQAGATGEVVLDGLPRGVAHLDASAAGKTGHARAFVPEEAETVVELAPLRRVEVLVVDEASGAPIAGAELEVWFEFPVPMALPGEESQPGIGGQEYWSNQPRKDFARTTDAEGHAVIDALAPSGRYELHVRARGYEPIPQKPVSAPLLDAKAEPLRIELERLPARTVRWPVVAGEVEAPPDGSAIELRHASGPYARDEEPEPPPPGLMEGTTLVVEGVVGRSFVARAPDGSLAALWIDEGSEIGRETSFRHPRKIEVLVHDALGEAAISAAAIARNQGNNDLCTEVATDAGGRAVLDGLYGALAEVYVGPAGQRPRQSAGSVDLAQGDGRIEVTLPATTSGRLRLIIDGRAELPAKFQVSGARVVEEFPDRGELRLSLSIAPSSDALKVGVTAPGFLRANAELLPPVDGSEAFAQIELARCAVLEAHVDLPQGEHVEIAPERFDETAQVFKSEPGLQGLSYPNGPDGSFVFSGLTPGRWRVIDGQSGLASTQAELFPGDREARVDLDLRSVTWVSGRVEVPDPAELARVVVLVEGTDAAPPSRGWLPGREPPEGTQVRDGAFRARVPGDRTVKLVPWHPWLVPAAECGAIEVREGREGVVLRLVEGDEVRLPVPQLASGSHVRSLRIGRYSEDESGEPIEWRNAPIADGVARFAVPRGAWTLWIDAGRDFAPLVLRDVVVEGVAMLAPAAFERGSAVRVRLLVAAGQAAPRVYVSAFHLGAPAYHRALNSGGESEVMLAGLAPGRFRVSASAIMGRRTIPERDVELDGGSDLALDFDLR